MSMVLVTRVFFSMVAVASVLVSPVRPSTESAVVGDSHIDGIGPECWCYQYRGYSHIAGIGWSAGVTPAPSLMSSVVVEEGP